MNSGLVPLKSSDPRSFGGWNIRGRIGEGGYSTIFLGEKEGRLAALKMIRRELLSDAQVFERFSTEINNLERIDHPGVAKIIESDLSTDVPYIAVEYVEGETLEQRISKNRPLEIQEWLDCLFKVAQALDYCHKSSVIHKDVSPGNIILSEDGPKLIDFGISYHEGDTRVTQPDQIVGTPAFMSPEHWDSRPKLEMDIFSLGSTFIYAGTGHTAFVGESKQEMRAAIWNEKPNFDGLNKTQTELLAPLLYKDSNERPGLSELIECSSKLKQNPEFSIFENYLKDSEKKLVKINNFSTRNRMTSKYLLIGLLFFAFSLGFLAFIVSSRNDNQEFPRPISSMSTSSINTSSNQSGASIEASTGNSSKEGANQDSVISKTSAVRKCAEEFDKKGTKILDLCVPPANQGDLSSIYSVGRYYFDNKNYKEAEKWFLTGAKKQDMNNMRYLIETYTQVANTKERDRWTKICADTNYGTSDFAPLNDLAYCKLMQGSILARAGNIKDAILYFTDSADYGNGDAATWLGIYYRDLDDLKNARKWLIRAAELDSKVGLDALINFAEKIGDRELTKKWLEISAESGNQVNMGLLALIFYWEKDFVSAAKWSEKGMKFGDITSTYVSGAIKYDQGKKAEGKNLILSAANKGDTNAIRKLGSIYRLDEKNLVEAAVWYKKLADRNDMSGTSMYSTILFLLGNDKESCTYNDKVLELGDRAKRNGTYDPAEMDDLMSEAKKTYDSWCAKMYPNK